MNNSYSIAGKTIQCPHCGGQKFDCKKVLMNTRGASFFNLDWMNRQAFALTCGQCGRVEWFAVEPAVTS